MRKINKILIISFLLGLYVLNFSFADNSDCGRFGILSYKQKWDNWFKAVTQSRNTSENKFSNFLTIDEQNAIIDNDSLNTAMLNLKKYCCENELWWLTQKSKTCVDDKVFFNDNALESQYLFDHLFDVIMRRLSWLTWEKNLYEKTNMTTDDKWREWRERINEKAQSTWWATPQIIIDQYVDTRKQSPSDLWYNISSSIYKIFRNDNEELLTFVSWQSPSKESQDVAKAIKQYDKWTLYDRYINACAMTEYFYALLDLWINSDDKYTTAIKVSNWVCNTAVNTQINAENSYVKLVIQQSSNLFLSNYIKWYMDYLRGRSDNVRSKQQKIKNNFFDIVNAVPKLVRQCVH
jgi:hypothetical protein